MNPYPRVSCGQICDERGRAKEPTAERRATENRGWTRDYVLLTLRTAKAVEARTGDGWMLDYYGPPEWKALVEAEEPRTGGALVEGVRELEESLSGEGFEARRTRYLGKHLRALETVARRLAGERLSLREQAAGCFDIDVGWVPETTFGAAHALYDEALPGGGDVRERLRRWKVRHELAPEKAALLPELVERAAREGRRPPATSSAGRCWTRKKRRGPSHPCCGLSPRPTSFATTTGGSSWSPRCAAPAATTLSGVCSRSRCAPPICVGGGSPPSRKGRGAKGLRGKQRVPVAGLRSPSATGGVSSQPERLQPAPSPRDCRCSSNSGPYEHGHPDSS